ncbi:MAG TPA: hypothetical protein VGO47_07450 [Chlamydiales bacterium]|jgi:hypothetical protein|nr:hypothetical protein [Chlamydiales bacterium]
MEALQILKHSIHRDQLNFTIGWSCEVEHLELENNLQDAASGNGTERLNDSEWEREGEARDEELLLDGF